jgi:hypothetical protein
MWNYIKRTLIGIKNSWYLLPNWQRHAGGSWVLIMCVAGIMQRFGDINWPLAGLIVFALGILKECFDKKNTLTEALKDIVWNILGILFGLIWYFI